MHLAVVDLPQPDSPTSPQDALAEVPRLGSKGEVLHQVADGEQWRLRCELGCELVLVPVCHGVP
jgi:hypothetical protein